MTRVYRIRVTSWPTPDGKPFDAQPIHHYAAGIEAWLDCMSPAGPDWMSNIEWAKHVKGPANPEPLPGVWLRAPGGIDFTVPAHKKVLFFTYAAAHARLAMLRDWGAVGHIETSEPVTWPERKQ